MNRHSLITLIPLLCLNFLSFTGITQPVIISGSAPGAEEMTIRLITWGDLITFREKTVAEAPIDSVGNFIFSYDLPATSYFALAIDLHRAEFYMVPNTVYRMRMTPMNYTDNLEVNPFIRSQSLEVELLEIPEEELNLLVNNYNQQYNQFLLDHFNALYLERKKTYLDTFRIKVNQPYLEINQPYFQDIIRYKTAGLEQIARSKNTYDLAKTYFIDQPILYNNVEYMQFFNTYFTKYMTASSNVLRKIDLTPVIKGPSPYPALMKALAADSVLRNENLRELVLLKGLYEMFPSKPDLQDDIIRILGTISQESSIAQNRVVAENILAKVTKLRKGTPAPDFTLMGMTKDRYHSLKDYRGKPVVINFWTTFCQGCLAEMEQQVPLFEKYRDKVEFVSICADRYWIKMHAFAMSKPAFAWTFLHYSGDTDLLLDYTVTTYPLYVVIDPNGNIVNAPAPTPGEGLEQVIESLVD